MYQALASRQVISLVANSHDLSVIGAALEKILTDNQEDLGLQDIFFGDQTLIARTPTACIEPNTVERIMNSTGFMTDNAVTAFIMLYHGKVQDKQLNRVQCLQYAEAIARVIHTGDNKNLGGLVVHGYISTLDAGFAVRSNSWFMVTRMTYHAVSRTPLYQGA